MQNFKHYLQFTILNGTTGTKNLFWGGTLQVVFLPIRIQPHLLKSRHLYS